MEKKIENYMKLLKRLQGQCLSWLDDEMPSSTENLILDIDENLSRASWRCQQLLRSVKQGGQN